LTTVCGDLAVKALACWFNRWVVEQFVKWRVGVRRWGWRRCQQRRGVSLWNRQQRRWARQD